LLSPSNVADLATRPILESPDCMTYPCAQDCCSHGADVWPFERDALIAAGEAVGEQFTGPEVDDEGDSLYRTAVGASGCVFLKGEGRGCRLHFTGLKPEVCRVVPRDADEAEEMHGDGQLPCIGSWRFG
jgi:hypothetical protein